MCDIYVTDGEVQESATTSPYSGSLNESNIDRPNTDFHLFVYIGFGVIPCCCVLLCGCVIIKYLHQKQKFENDSRMIHVEAVATTPSLPQFAISCESVTVATTKEFELRDVNSVVLPAIHSTLGCNLEEDEDQNQDQGQDEYDHDIIQPYKITVGAEQDVKIESDALRIDHDIAKTDDGEMGFEEILTRQQPHHELQLTNAASEGGSDDVLKI